MMCFAGAFFLLLSVVLGDTWLQDATRKFHVVQEKKTWSEARTYCRTNYTDLAAIRSQGEADSLRSKLNGDLFWFRLPNDTLKPDIWTWTDQSSTNESQFLYDGWPDWTQTLDTVCFCILPDSKMVALPCWYQRPFFCEPKDMPKLVLENRTWPEASDHCKSLGVKLYTHILTTPPDTPQAWIGLIKKKSDKEWKWTDNTAEVITTEWPGGQLELECGAISNEKLSFSESCLEERAFICLEKLELVQQEKTWEEALESCMSLPTAPYRLASLQPEPNTRYNLPDQGVWTGLRFLGNRWLWINGEPLSETVSVALGSSLPLCPALGAHCGILTNRGTLEPRDCLETRYFLCSKSFFDGWDPENNTRADMSFSIR